METRAAMAAALTAQAEAFSTLLASAEAELADARARLAQVAAEHELLRRGYDHARKLVHEAPAFADGSQAQGLLQILRLAMP